MRTFKIRMRLDEAHLLPYGLLACDGVGIEHYRKARRAAPKRRGARLS